jgi:hypothetical protein
MKYRGNMKKVIILFVIFFTLFASCKKKEDYTKELNDFLQKWAFSTKELNYKLYKKTVYYVKNIEQFKAKFSDFYYENPVIIKVKQEKKENGDFYFKLNVTFLSVKRDNLKQKSDINGIFDIEKDRNGYKIKRHIFINNEYN